MNILILLKSFNYPPRNGGDQAVINAIRKMAAYVQYHLISTDESENGRQTIEAFREDFPQIPASIYPLGKRNKYQQIYDKCLRISNFINKRNNNRKSVDMRMIPYDTRLDYYDLFYRYIDNYIRENQIDIVQGEFQFTLGWLKGITAPCKKVFVHHELQYVVNYQRLMQCPHTKEDLWHYRQEKQQEINALNACDGIITLSQDDAQKLRDEGVHTSIFPSFAQITLHHVEIPDSITLRKRLVFIGPETHTPNKQGMQWFLDNVWTLVLDKEPTTQLAVIGKWSETTSEQWSMKYQNIEFLGFVEELVAAIKESILIVPLFQGSGIRMKILEACNIGIPFVATTIGAEGLGFTDGVDCFITDDNKVFVEKIQYLLKNADLANDMVRNSIHHIKEHFSDEQFVQSRMVCYKEMLKK